MTKREKKMMRGPIRRIRIVRSLRLVMNIMTTTMEMIRGTEMTPIDRRLGRR